MCQVGEAVGFVLAIAAPTAKGMMSGAGGVRYSISKVLVAIREAIRTGIAIHISTPIASTALSDRVVSPTAALGGTGMGSRPSLGSV